ncbi:MAG: glycosyltransferase family 2 protein [Thermoanaerobaculia bacterium]|nr:glycosyltransferase family 2 protein [Thermoanaerobaculia bacterium]
MTPRAAILIATYNAERDVADCLAAVAALSTRPLEVVWIDGGSTDRTAERVRAEAHRLAAAGIPFELVAEPENIGYAAAMNVGIRRTTAPWVLALNADARLAPDYVDRLLGRVEAHGDRAGAATGRLLRFATAGERDRLDACGMYLVRAWRHFDRGSDEPDHGQFQTPARVFGATGAASLFGRRALEDVAVGPGHYFDELFHSYREDAELAFRLQERGWDVLYEPAAQARHRRFNLPQRRSAMSDLVNFHTLKNRYLLRAYHQTAGNFWRTLPWTLPRDVLAFGYVLLRERSSLPAYAWLLRNRRDILLRRKKIQSARTHSLEPWFNAESFPV